MLAVVLVVINVKKDTSKGGHHRSPEPRLRILLHTKYIIIIIITIIHYHTLSYIITIIQNHYHDHTISLSLLYMTVIALLFAFYHYSYNSISTLRPYPGTYACFLNGPPFSIGIETSFICFFFVTVRPMSIKGTYKYRQLRP